MSTLFNLPTEIRALIIQFALYAGRDITPDPNGKARKQLDDLGAPKVGSRGLIHYEVDSSAYATNAEPLFLVNHQFYQETKDCVRRLPAAAQLDVAFVNALRLYPSWTSISVRSTHYGVVQATFRICGPLNPGRGSAFRGGDGGPPTLVWGFYSLLERFLAVGPRPPAEGGVKYRDFAVTIGVLDIDFTSPVVIQPDWNRLDTNGRGWWVSGIW